jgi:hypothetical protein
LFKVTSMLIVSHNAKSNFVLTGSTISNSRGPLKNDSHALRNIPRGSRHYGVRSVRNCYVYNNDWQLY